MQHIPWIEKYRPNKLDDIVYQQETINILKNIVTNNNMPHLLLYGPPGTGKTTSILVLANILFGPKYVNERVLELNASDDRGINIVRTKIMNFAKEKLSSTDSNYPSPPFKIIILDEADAMTKEAQSALKKIIEINSNITRFCLICNYISKIIEPIQSRCSKLRFKLIIPEIMNLRLNEIIKKENLCINSECLNIITKSASGDMRKAIMFIQNTKYINKKEKNITKEDINKITNYVEPESIKKIIQLCLTKENNFIEILNYINDVWKNGLPINNILEITTNEIVLNNNLNDNQKQQILFYIIQIDKYLINGADEEIQLISLFNYIKAITNIIKIKDPFDII